ncbi:MAG TPA: hypothetical protein VE934_06725 [Polaromonas sp.]|uniref:hypothetical protein n=1 Tax=Polaromonas sp. TaxID=1869339 RepID=UPI002D2D55CD|nr:hypothetical protein [Polaromonas sp.]HYW56634.1 hypothetical protein [Polaromonas sp.]
MRHLLLALLIALLPVRGWVGNAMAVDMAAQRAAATIAQQAMPADCPMHAQAADQDGSASQQTPGDKAADQGKSGKLCADCDTCQLCLALASFTWTDLPTGSHSAHSGPVGTGIRFSSADNVFSLKPPIS